MVLISERPAEVADRAVPRHGKGDLIMGAGNRSALGTLVRRSTRCCLLLCLPHGGHPVQVRDALVAWIGALPVALRRSLTWDQGSEMRYRGRLGTATDMPVCFCDPYAPWQRGTNVNTNGLLGQYVRKGADLSVHTAQRLAEVVAELNGRPRMTLGWDTPAERIAGLPGVRS